MLAAYATIPLRVPRARPNEDGAPKAAPAHLWHHAGVARGGLAVDLEGEDAAGGLAAPVGAVPAAPDLLLRAVEVAARGAVPEGAVTPTGPVDAGAGPGYAPEEAGAGRRVDGGPPCFAVGAVAVSAETGGEVGRVAVADVDDDAYVVTRLAARPKVVVANVALPLEGRVPAPVPAATVPDLVAVEGGGRDAGVDRAEAPLRLP